MRVFVDTSAIVALALVDERRHRQARAHYDSARGTHWVTSDHILDEAVTRLRKLAGHATAVKVGNAWMSQGAARLVPVEAADRTEAWRLFCQMADKPLSFTDCTVVAQMRRLEIPSVFAFDDDFRKMGVKVVP